MHSIWVLLAVYCALAAAGTNNQPLYTKYIASCQQKYANGNGMWHLEPVLVTSWAQFIQLSEQNAIKLRLLHKRILECVASKKLKELQARADQGARRRAQALEAKFYVCMNATTSEVELAFCVADLLEESTEDGSENLSRGKDFWLTLSLPIPDNPFPAQEQMLQPVTKQSERLLLPLLLLSHYQGSPSTNSVATIVSFATLRWLLSRLPLHLLMPFLPAKVCKSEGVFNLRPGALDPVHQCQYYDRTITRSSRWSKARVCWMASPNILSSRRAR